MSMHPTYRFIDLTPNRIRATNIESELGFRLTPDGLVEADMVFDRWAHLSFSLLTDDSLQDARNMWVSFDARVASGKTQLWSALVDDHSSWHSPIDLGWIDEQWRCLTLKAKDYFSLTNSFKILKLIVRNDCRLEVRNMRVDGVSAIDSLKIVIPWFNRNPVRTRARDTAIERLAEQDIPFDLVLLELVTDENPASFFPKRDNHQHILIHKDRRYDRIFHKESLLNYFLDNVPLNPHAAYMFMDSDIYADDKSWLGRIVERLSRAVTDNKALLLQPFSNVCDTVTGRINHSLCSAEARDMHTRAINPGLCWATTGKTILERRLRFPHKLVTGIADAVFAAGHVASRKRIPYLPPFSLSSITVDNPCETGFIDEDLNHVNHGEILATSYAMRDLLWQACLDHGALVGKNPIAEDEDGFMYFPELNGQTQCCVAHLMDLRTPDSVLAQVLRTFGAPANTIQHIVLDGGVDIHKDPRSLNGRQRLDWECARSNFRLYALGVEKTIVVSRQCSDSVPEFPETPFLRNMVSDHASHPVVMLTASTVMTYPSMLPNLTEELRKSEIVFFSGIPESFDVEIDTTAPPPIQSDSMDPLVRIAAVAFTLAWWEENQIALPHGLLADGNHLDCLFRLVYNKWPNVSLISGHCRILSTEPVDPSLEKHNLRVSNGILTLHDRGFLEFGPIDRNRRRIKLAAGHSGRADRNLVAKNAMLGRLHNDSGVLFNPQINATFHDTTGTDLPYRKKWSGIVHGIIDAPEHLPDSGYNLHPMLNDRRFAQSLEHCAGIFTHSDTLRRRLLDSGYWNPNVPIEILPYTVAEPKTGFRADWFCEQRKPTLYAIGYFAKRLGSFLDLEAKNFQKILVAPTRSQAFQEYFQIEKTFCSKPDPILVQNRSTRTDCDWILSRNPVFLDYYDLSASSVLSECIVRNTPVILRRHPAAEEILGADYPLFFSDLEQATELLNESSILESHVFLANVPKRNFFHPMFLEKLQSSWIYRCF